MDKLKKLAILGSTGSIGTQALEVIASNPERFCVEVLTANSNADLLVEQTLKFKPNCIVIADETKYQYVKDALNDSETKVYAGSKAIAQVVQMDSIDQVLTAQVGFSGLLPTINAIQTGKNIALANKETLVVAGSVMQELCQQNNVRIYPVDSEHSAIFQCLMGEWLNPVEKIILTASGGPFRGFSIEQLAKVSRQQALKHPNWTMGSKITIDSASLMNKALEVIEAKWLFDLKSEQIEVVVHPQSIIHSIVQFSDGSMKAQMGLPDMKLPIQFALTYPDRIKSDFPRFDFSVYPTLTFEKPDLSAFRGLSFAYHALNKGGNMACILNAANEIANAAFLNERIPFLRIYEIIEHCMNHVGFIQNPTLEDLMETDAECRKVAESIVS